MGWSNELVRGLPRPPHPIDGGAEDGDDGYLASSSEMHSRGVDADKKFCANENAGEFGPGELAMGGEHARSKAGLQLLSEFDLFGIGSAAQEEGMALREEVLAEGNPFFERPLLAFPAGGWVEHDGTFEVGSGSPRFSAIAGEAERRYGRAQGQNVRDGMKIFFDAMSLEPIEGRAAVKGLAPEPGERLNSGIGAAVRSAEEEGSPAAAVIIAELENIIEGTSAESADLSEVGKAMREGAPMAFRSSGGEEVINGWAARENSIGSLADQDGDFGSGVLSLDGDQGRGQEQSVADMF